MSQGDQHPPDPVNPSGSRPPNPLVRPTVHHTSGRCQSPNQTCVELWTEDEKLISQVEWICQARCWKLSVHSQGLNDPPCVTHGCDLLVDDGDDRWWADHWLGLGQQGLKRLLELLRGEPGQVEPVTPRIPLHCIRTNCLEYPRGEALRTSFLYGRVRTFFLPRPFYLGELADKMELVISQRRHWVFRHGLAPEAGGVVKHKDRDTQYHRA